MKKNLHMRLYVGQNCFHPLRASSSTRLRHLSFCLRVWLQPYDANWCCIQSSGIWQPFHGAIGCSADSKKFVNLYLVA